MMRPRMFNVIRNIIIVGFFLVAVCPLLAKMADEDTVSVSATVAQDNIIIFSGDACPSCQVFLLMEDSIADSATSQGDGSFQFGVEDVEPITHQFGVYAVDGDNIRSGTSIFSVGVSQGAIIYVSDILVSPTLKIGDNEVEKGVRAVLSGYTVPNSKVVIEVDGGSMLIEVDSGENGGYRYFLDTSNVQLGNHWARAKVQTDTDISAYSEIVDFDVIKATQEDEDDDDEDEAEQEEEEEEEEASAVGFPATTIEQQIEQIKQGPFSGGPVDFAVLVANENSRVSSGEFLELYLTFINISGEFIGEKAELFFDLVDPSNDELYSESYGLTLDEAQRLKKKIKIPCFAREGGYLAKAEFVIDQQRFIKDASFQVSRGSVCPKTQTGLETSLISQNVGSISLREYVNLLVALTAVLLIIILILLNKVLLRKKDE